MRTVLHHHRCQNCGAKTPCDGQLEDNYDGEPAITCALFHLPNGDLNQAFVCDGCTCVDCSERATTTALRYTWHDRFVAEPVCTECKEKRDNYEPSDGEAWSGGFAANH